MGIIILIMLGFFIYFLVGTFFDIFFGNKR